MFKPRLFGYGLAAVLLLGACSSTDAEEQTEPVDTAETDTPSEPTVDEEGFTVLESGVKFKDLTEGEGRAAEIGDRVVCHYTLWFQDGEPGEKGTRFQSSKDDNRPFPCQLGVNLIEGWSEGMVGMKPGGVREVHVPWTKGYGANGYPGHIPGEMDLIFEIEFVRYQ